jgi:amino acid transporter
MPDAPKLRRELGVRDLTLFATTCIVSTRWIPAAAHSGPGAISLWLLTAVLFVAPLAVTVGTLAAKYPGSGGLYLWTRGDFGPWHGFLCFWVYWMGMAVWFPSAAVFYMSSLFYGLGPGYQHLADNRFAVLAASLAAIWIALGTNLIGMKIGKWTENVGGVAVWIAGALIMAVGFLIWSKRGPATPINPMPVWNWETVSFWGSMAYGMSGLEMAALVGDEIHDPARTMPRAGWIASAVAVIFYIGTTAAMLALLRPDTISEMTGWGQAADAAGRSLGAMWLAPAVALLVLLSGMGQFGGVGASISRMPFAAGADGLLPKTFARVHPRWGTPYVSILGLGTVATFLMIAVQLGDTLRAAYQAMVSLMVIAGFIPYIYIFGSAWIAGKRVSAVCGWGITGMAIVTSVIPTAEIRNVWLFEGKLALGTAAVIGSAWLVYRRRAASRCGAEL